MPIRRFHDFKAFFEKFFRHGLVEEVGHAIDEYLAGTLPLKWKFDCFRMEGELEAALVFWISHPPKPLRESFSVTVLAAGGDLGTSRGGIPSCICPLN